MGGEGGGGNMTAPVYLRAQSCVLVILNKIKSAINTSLSNSVIIRVKILGGGGGGGRNAT